VEPGDRFLGIILLFSLDTCELLAIMQGGVLQRMRVGATGGVGVRCLAREDARSVGLIRSGWQAGAQLVAMCEVMDINHVKVYSTSQKNRERFAEEMSRSLDVNVEPVGSARECIKGVDIVNLATSAREPVLEGDWLEEGMHVHSVHWPELDKRTYERSGVIITNVRPYGMGREKNPYCLEYIMESIPETKALEHGFDHIDQDWGKLPGLSDVLLGTVPGRREQGEITLHINNVGLGMQFAAVGAGVHKKAKAQGWAMRSHWRGFSRPCKGRVGTKVFPPQGGKDARAFAFIRPR
jgi:ornithine cyclodeaminase/alanine dehydrogenase-like protein (mu-crystallin family)